LSAEPDSWPGVRLLDLEPDGNDFRRDALQGLLQRQKSIPPKYFYDERGSSLFEAITDLDEYYLTRTELAIMESHLPEMANSVGPNVAVIEFGAGSGVKTRRLLAELKSPAAYVPVDISRESLLGLSAGMAQRFPEIEVLPVCADFTKPFVLPEPRREPSRRLLYFPGSTIGNFENGEAQQLLSVMRDVTAGEGALLIGVDLRKDPEVLEMAYNDPAGVTAEFNLNLLHRMNRELEASFDPERFRHQAEWNDQEGHIEMHLVSLEHQVVQVAGELFTFRAGETLLTEYSHKYDLGEFADLAATAGWAVEEVWTDPACSFSVQLLNAGAPAP